MKWFSGGTAVGGNLYSGNTMLSVHFQTNGAMNTTQMDYKDSNHVVESNNVLSPTSTGNGSSNYSVTSNVTNVWSHDNLGVMFDTVVNQAGLPRYPDPEPGLTDPSDELLKTFLPPVRAANTLVGVANCLSGNCSASDAAGVAAAVLPGMKVVAPAAKSSASALEKVVARNGGEIVEGGAQFATRRQARQAASELAGNLGSDVQAIRMRDFVQANVPWGLRDSNKVIGRQSADGLAGWRDDFLGHPRYDMGPHVNVWTDSSNFHFFY